MTDNTQIYQDQIKTLAFENENIKNEHEMFKKALIIEIKNIKGGISLKTNRLSKHVRFGTDKRSVMHSSAMQLDTE